MPNSLAEDAGSFCKGYAPESDFVSAPLEDDRPFAGDPDVVAVLGRRNPVTFVENGDISIVSKGSDAEEQVG